MPRPIDIVVDSGGRWRALYEDGSLGPALALDEDARLPPESAGSAIHSIADNVIPSPTDSRKLFRWDRV